MRFPQARASPEASLGEAERIVAWLRLPAVALLALGGTFSPPTIDNVSFLAALLLFAVWSAGALVAVNTLPTGEGFAIAATAIDIAVVTALAVLSGGAYSHARLAYFLVPIAAAFRLRPIVTGAATVVTTAAYVVQALVHPGAGEPGALRFTILQAGFIAWVGLASMLLSLLLARRNRLLVLLADERTRLLADALEAEQRERRQLAEALHDDALQNLLSVRHDLHEAADGGLQHPALERAEAAIVATVRQLRDTVFELHPYVLDQAGLAPALRSVAQHAASQTGAELELELDYDGQVVAEHLLFSAARELLGNAVRHADATRIAVRLAPETSGVVLTVEDDGCGFAPEQLRERLAEGHVGLASQRVRIESAGGRMHIDSAPRRGTRVEIWLPRLVRPTSSGGASSTPG